MIPALWQSSIFKRTVIGFYMIGERQSSMRIDRILSATLILFLASPICNAEDVFDLSTDWSDSTNPNGEWTYREGSNALPLVADWITEQSAWAPSADAGNFLPGWFRSTADGLIGLDLLTGDVAVHTTDSFNGAANGPANVIWTSPGAGTITIAGAVWMARDIVRSNDWSLLHNGVPLTGGSISSGDPFDRANPFDFAGGSGGAAVLQDIPVLKGDVIELEIIKSSTSTFGDFVGVILQITLMPQLSFYSINSKSGADDLVIIDSADGSVTIIGSLGVDVGAADLAVFNERLFLLRDGSNGADPLIPTLMEIAPSTGAVFSSVDLTGVGSENRAEGLATVSGQLLVAFSNAGTSSDTLGDLGLDGIIRNTTGFSTDFDGLGADSTGNVFSSDQFSPGSSNSRLYAVDVGVPLLTNLNTIASVGLNDLAFSECDRLFGIDVFVDGFTSSRLLREFNPSTGDQIGSVAYESNFRLFGLAPTIPSPESDIDSMDDSWENHFFGDLSRDGSGDFDRDGMTDASEFLAATDPLNNLSLFRITDISSSTGSVTITWDSIEGRVYRVQYTDSLGEATWMDLGGDISATATSTSTIDNTINGVTQRFYRVILAP